MALFSMVLLSLTLSCSKGLWEQRSECPSAFVMDFSGVSEDVESLDLWIVNSESGEVLHCGRVVPYNYSNPMKLQLKRGLYSWYLWGGVGKATEVVSQQTESVALKKRENLSADSLWFAKGTVDARGEETIVESAVLAKEFINCKFRLRGGLLAGETLQLICYGTTVGYSMEGALMGGVSHTLVEGLQGSDGICETEFRLMRQSAYKGLMLTLVISKPQGNPATLAEIKLGEILKEIGYDMMGELRDIDFTVDASLGLLTINVKDWNQTYDVNIEF